MTPEKQDIIFTKYHPLFEGYKESRWAIKYGIACEDGWFDIVDRCTSEIMTWKTKHPEVPLKVVQIKEKFGTLRYYLNPSYTEMAWEVEHRKLVWEELTPLTAKWETLSAITCEFCGATPAQATSKEVYRWVRTLCPTCTANYPANWEAVREARWKAMQEEYERSAKERKK